MRLTLRTLLAYMDGVLEPADAEDIEEKIRESEFATGIVNRVRDVVRQLRLGAPRVKGKGMGLDPNMVAEYLDNTLPTEQVPDFEKKCLESDTQLAEVAACHQVLTLVLGEPAEVTPDSRERMYGLINESKVAAADTAEAPTVGNGSPSEPEEATPTDDSPKKERQKPEIPDYLREPSGRPLWPVAAALLLLGMLACAAVLAVGPQNILALFRDEAPTNDVAIGEQEQAVPLLQNDAAPETGDLVNEEITVTESPVEEPIDEEGILQPSEFETPAEPPVPGSMPEVMPSEGAVPEPASPADSNTSLPEGTPPTEAMTVEEETVTEEVMEEPPQPDPALDPAIEPPAPSLLGRFVSDRTVLLKFDAEASNWNRLPALSAIGPGDLLLAMPAFDSTLALGSGISLVLLGGTMVEFGPPDANGTPLMAVHYGRVLIVTAGDDTRGIHLVGDGQQGWLGVAEQNSIAAVEAKRTLEPGADPEAEPAKYALRLYVSQGNVTWRTSEDVPPETLSAPYQHTLGIEADEAAKPLPEWLVKNTTPLIEQRGAELIEEHLAEEREIALRATLKELVEHRRSEVKALAARCLVHLHVYDPVIKALANPAQHAAWPALIAELSHAIANSPQEADGVHQALLLERGEEGQKLYRLLQGYSPEQLRDGAAEELVEGLDNEAVDIRVLSFWNLHNITGEMNAYRADHTAARRKPAVQRWREQLEAGKIVPAEVAVDVETEEAVAPPQ